jgi:uncharacterized protein
MPELTINCSEGRIEARYQPGKLPNAPVAIILHPHPEYGGSMNNRVVYAMYQTFAARGFATLRFNFRGVGRSQGIFTGGEGELSDAANILDWLQVQNPNARSCWVAGFSFGAWIGMQLLMRRPEVNGFISVAPPANIFDFSFLAPCPTSGMIIAAENDQIVPLDSIKGLAEKISRQRDTEADLRIIPDTNHFFNGKIEEFTAYVNEYIDQILNQDQMLEAV